MTEWITAPRTDRPRQATAFMEARAAAAIHEGTADELIWLVGIRRFTPPAPRPAPTICWTRASGPRHRRGGKYTYHRPGQRVIYVMLDLNRRGRDVRAFVQSLENWVIDALAEFNLKGEIRGAASASGSHAPTRRPARRRDARGQDRRHRRQAAQMGQLSRHFDQCRAGPEPLRRYRPLRHLRAWRHQPC